MEGLVNIVGTLRMAILTEELESLVCSASDQEDLLKRVQLAQEKDENLIKVSKNDKTQYQTSNDGTNVVNGRVCVPNDQKLREKNLKKAHLS